MAKVVKFPISPPLKFGPQRVRKKKISSLEKNGQLNLFTGGKIISLLRLTAFEEALLLDEQGDLSAARTRYLLAIEKNDALADAYCNLGILEFQEGNTSKAIDYLTLSLKNEPRHFEAHYNLANVFSDVGNLPLAKVHYQISIEMEPAFPNSVFNLGLTLAMNKEFKEAIRVLKQYIQLTPESEHKEAHDLILKLQSQAN